MIEYVTIDQAAELDAFVLRQPNCHFMQTSAWGRVKEGWGWTGILCRDEKGEIIGSMAILEHRIRHMHTGFLYAPRGPIFRDGDYATLEALVDAMRALAEKRGDYMIRIDPMLEETDTAFLDEVRRLGFTQCMIPARRARELKPLPGLELLPVQNIAQALRLLVREK